MSFQKNLLMPQVLFDVWKDGEWEDSPAPELSNVSAWFLFAKAMVGVFRHFLDVFRLVCLKLIGQFPMILMV